MTKKIIYSVSIFLTLVVIGLGIGMNYEDNTVNYGHSSDSIPLKRSRKSCCQNLNTKGLADLNVHASGFINFNKDKSIFDNQIKNLYVINLLHDNIYYYQGRSLRWYGLGYTPKTLGTPLFPTKQVKTAFKSLIRFVYGTPPIHDIQLLQTEKDIIEKMGGHYYLPLKDNEDWLFQQHFVDDLITYFEALPSDANLYIHCAHGKGRTTTFLALYDMFRNAKNVSLQDVANRHYCLGREDILDTEVWEQGTWTKEALVARKELVERFHHYMTAKDGYPHQSWSQWLKKNYKTNDVKGSIHR